jgi:hypothetical protein
MAPTIEASVARRRRQRGTRHWYNDTIAQGGHPGITERQALADAKADRDRAASQVQRICGP